MTDEEMLAMLTEWIAGKLGVPDLVIRVEGLEAKMLTVEKAVLDLKTELSSHASAIEATPARIAAGDAATREAVAGDVAKVDAAIKELNGRLLEVEGRRRQLAEDLINTLRMSAGG